MGHRLMLSGTMWIRLRSVPCPEIKCQKFGDSMCGEFRPKTIFLSLTLNRYTSVTHRLAKLLTFYVTTRDRPYSKPYGPWPAGVGGP